MDKYTKFILTLIALSLMWISFNIGSLFPNAIAGSAGTKIEITDVSVSSSRPLPVVITGKINCTK